MSSYVERSMKENPEFSITIGGVTYSDQKEAGDALNRVLEERGDDTLWADVTTIHGLKLRVGSHFKAWPIEWWAAELRGQRSYDFTFKTDPVGNIQRILNTLQGIRGKADYLEQHKIPDHEAKIGEMQKRLGKPFERDEELSQKSKRLDGIRDELSISDDNEQDGASAFKSSKAAPPPPRQSSGRASAMSAAAASAMSARTEPDPFAAQATATTDTGKPVSNHWIAAQMERLFGVPIRFGNFKVRDAAGIYKFVIGKSPAPEVVRLAENFVGNLGVISHEVAHHIDRRARVGTGKKGVLGAQIPRAARAELKSLDYEPKKRRTHEGFAEFIRHLLTRDDAAMRAPQFYEWFVNVWLPAHPDMRDKLIEAKEHINRWRFQGAEKRVRSARSKTGKPEGITIKDKASAAVAATQRWVDDDLSAIERAMNEVRKHREVPVGADPYTMARVLRNREGALAIDAVHNGVRSLVTNKLLGPSLISALKQLGDFTIDEFEQFTDYLHARHGLDVWMKGKNPGISREDAQHVFSLHDGNEAFRKAAETVTAWNKAHIRMLAEVGAISPQAEQLILQSYPAHIPLKRVVDSLKAAGVRSGFVNVRAPIKHLKGSGRQIIEPFAAMLQSSIQMHAAATKVLVGRRIVDLAESIEGGGWLAEKVAAPTQTMRTTIEKLSAQLEAAGADLSDADLEAVLSITQTSGFRRGGEPIAFIVRNGRAEWYRYDTAVYQAIANMEPLQLPLWADIALWPLTTTTKSVRLGATGLRVSFAVGSNVVRDAHQATIQTEGNLAQVLPRIIGFNVRQAVELWTGEKDGVTALYDRYGGVLSGYVGQDIRVANRQVRDLINNARGRRFMNIVFHPVETLQRTLSIPEMAPRMAEVRAVLKKRGYTEEDLKNDAVPMEVIFEALLAGNEVTIDFSRSGTAMRFINGIAAFSNVMVQGPMQVARKAGIKSVDPRKWDRKRLLRTVVRGTVTLTIPTLAYWWMVKDEDWYEELPAWRRFFFWNFRLGGRTWSIPRPFELGTIFASIPEAIADSWYRNDDKRVRQLAEETFKQYGTESVTPDALRVAFELAPEMGYDTWRERQIVPKGLERVEPKDRFTEFNTMASRRLGQWFDASPAKIDHAIYNTTGGLGTDLLRIPDEGPWRALGYGRFVRAFGAGESMDEFYDHRKTITEAFNSAKLKGEPNKELVRQYRRLDDFSELISGVRDAARAIDDDAEKQRITNFATGLARQALKKPPLAEFPSIFDADKLPEKVQAVRDDYLSRKGMTAALPMAEQKKGESTFKYERRRMERIAEIRAALDILRELDADEGLVSVLVRRRARKRGLSDNGAQTYEDRFKERL